MDIEKISTEDIENAKAKWKEYKEACKNNPKDKYLQDMKAVYNQVKAGRKLIDIGIVFQRAEINELGEPKLAIAPADLKHINCKYYRSGALRFSRKSMTWYESELKEDVIIKGFPKIENDKLMKTLVPPIPPSLRPKSDLKNYYILWDVEKWDEVPLDPYLLRRINGNIFVILAAWDLTELERAVIKGQAW